MDQDTQDMAQKFIDDIHKGELGRVKFEHLVNFRAMQNMTRNQKGSKNYRYWEDHDWLDANYYTDAPAHPVARMMAGYISKRMRRSIRKGNARPIR